MRIPTRTIVVGVFVTVLLMAYWCWSRDRQPRVIYAKQLEMDVRERCGAVDTLVDAQKHEVFIIQNPPYETSDMMKIIRANETFSPIDKDMVERRYEMFVRYYYKESSKTRIDSKNRSGGYFDRAYFHDNVEDLICKIEMRRRDHTWIPDSLRVTWECSCPELEDMIAFRPR